MKIYKPEDKLSPHFTFGELIRSQTASRHGIDNTPNPEKTQNLISVCQGILEPIRKYYNKPIFVTSGFRCEELNEKIGGSISSQHIKGEAVDFVVSGHTPYLVWKWIVTKSGLEFDQCIGEFCSKKGGGWIHVSYTTFNKNRKKITTAVKENNKTVYNHYTVHDILKGNFKVERN